MAFVIGYGRGEIEPAIAPLVQAAQDASFVTFSSCEGHPEVESIPRYPCVGFYANEDEARAVHIALVDCRSRLTCSWVFRGGFVYDPAAEEWRLGWTLECWGTTERIDDAAQFRARTIEAARATDIPALVQMFAELARRT
jgi:hypothetical protein